MHPHHDIDVIILMATALASKRRPAELVEIVAAADLLQGFIPYVDKLGDAIVRLSGSGLIVEADGCFTLTLPAQEIMAELPKKADAEERIAIVENGLRAHQPKTESSVIRLTVAQLTEAILAHKASRQAPGKNLLMPKPKTDSHFKVEGRWRRAPGARGRKT